jgi:predicted HTH domain antitoxin
MKTLIIQIPDTVDFDDFEALMAIASTLYSKGRLSLGQAADLAGLSKSAFMGILGANGVSVFNYPSSELDRDIETVRLHGAGL